MEKEAKVVREESPLGFVKVSLGRKQSLLLSVKTHIPLPENTARPVREGTGGGHGRRGEAVAARVSLLLLLGHGRGGDDDYDDPYHDCLYGSFHDDGDDDRDHQLLPTAPHG
jgi:hypothetical protein